jgi:hypothetical protein
MKSRRFVLALAAGVLALGLGAQDARAGGLTLADVLGTTQAYGGLDFTFTTFTSTDLTAAQVSITFVGAGTSEVGFVLTSSFGAAMGTSQDSDLVYTVSGASITDALLTGNPAGTGTGVASITETFHSGTSEFGPVIGSLFLSNTSSPNPITTTFSPPQTAITVVKDIESIGGTTGVSLSSVGQAFSSQSVPEPGSWALLGIGMTGFLAFRRFFKKTSVA